ncbi:MAG: amino acid adenylation domain-containing protein [Methylovulum sp.]|nr:amino acid adenylation domain-containing protein [Methylovulum sp.]
MKQPPHYFHEEGTDVVADGASTLVELLRLRALQQTHKAAYTFLADGGNQALSLSYGDLDQQARIIAAHLQDLGLQGGRALLLYAPGLDYIAAFFGCLYAGVVAVPAYPPRNQRNLPRLQAILADSGAAAILSTAALAGSATVSAWQNESGLKQRWLLTDTLTDGADSFIRPSLDVSSLAFLQYTSGSTGNAKGVMVSHGNLMANQKLIKACFGHDSESTVVGWLPLYHDMGLIGNIMQPLYSGAPVILMSPLAFLEQPLRWLQAISDYRAHTSGGPNFAYDLCVQKITEEDKAGLDLSGWRLAFNGAEPVQAATLERFGQAFAGCGFRRDAFYPCYGLAEATLLVTGAAKNTPPTVKAFDKARLAERLAYADPVQIADYRKLVGCGTAGAGHTIRIAGPGTHSPCADGQTGEIQVSGPSIAQGYWRNAKATAETFAADTDGTVWLRTGDLGFIDDGELFVSGRIKDLIIVRGCNYYPHDLEAAAEAAVDCLNTGCIAAFAVTNEGGERLVLLAELKRSRLRQADYRREFAAIRSRVVEDCGVQLDTIVLLKPGAILKTTSGKIRRSACREAFEKDSLPAVARDELDQAAQQNCGAAMPDVDTGLAKKPTLPEQALLRQALLLASPDDGVHLLTQYLAAKVAALSGLALEQILAPTCSADRPVMGLGIDSLKAMELKYFIDDFLDINLPVALLLEDRSLAAIAEHALTLAKNNTPVVAAAQEARRQGAEQPLSLGQQAIWTVCRLDPQTPVYNMPVALRIRSAIDTQALQAALQGLLDRHGQLRTVFGVNKTMEPVQRLLPDAQFLLELVNCADDQERAQKINAQLRQPFNLGNGLLLRAQLYSTADDHVLVFCAHHIAVDFRSLAILLDELKCGYAAQIAGHPALLPPLTASYDDYIAWQKNYLDSEQAGQDLAYWRGHLQGELPKLELPLDRPRALAASYRGGAETLGIDPATVQKLRNLAECNNATLYTVLLGLFNVLLHRYSGQQDIIIGTPTLGRPKQDFADLVGYFVNPVALRSKPSGAKTFTGFLAEVRQTVLGGLAHQDYPFSLLVEKMQPERSGGLWPFYQVMFVWQGGASAVTDAAALALGTPGMAIGWPGVTAESLALTEGIAQFDLTLMMAEADGGLSATFQYRAELFARETILRMLGHFQCLLQGILAQPDMRLSELPLLTVSERERQLTAWNQTRLAYPYDLCIHQWFEIQAAKTPDSTAAVFQQQTLSYAGLNAKSNQLANYLCARGVGPETRIAVCMERSLELLVSLLAVLKAGAAYVPVDPSYPLDRQNYVLEDAGCKFLLARSGLTGAIAHAQAEIICVDNDAPVYADCCTQDLRPLAVANNTAYLIYTSGSTGKPKGVMVSHRNVVHSTWARFQYYQEPVGCYLLLSSFAFDSSVAGIFWTLSRGGCLCLPEDGLPKDPIALGELIGRRQVTHILALPSLYAALLEHVPAPRLASLKTVIVAGEACSESVAAQHHKLLPDVRLYNEYGPTEATVWSTVHAVGTQETGTVISIGRPVSNMQSYILDRHLQPVPVGVTGELHVGGEGITRGYLNRPGLTAEKFMPNPFGKAGSRLYKTGDLACYRPDGAIEFCGRIDTQIKLRGYRIELGEIESRLLLHPALKEAVVLVREDSPGNRRLVAYVVAKQAETVAAATLKTLLSDSLPDYMVPGAFVFLAALPLNANGKLDRAVLPAPEALRLAQREPVAPRDEAEAAIAGIWREALGIDRLCIHDNFFELGGHSLSGVQIMLRVQELFALELPVKMLFEAPTIAELVDRVADYQASEC